MPQPFKVVKNIRGKESFLRNVAVEVRYQDGYRYLDRCGFFLNWLTREDPDWVLPNQPTPQTATALNIRTGAALALSSTSAGLALDRTDEVEEITPDDLVGYIGEADRVLNKALDEFEVRKLSRLGFRQQFYFSFESVEETEDWIRGLGLIPAESALHKSFGAKPHAAGLSFVMIGPECRYRVGVSGGERPVSVPVANTLVNIQQSTANEQRRKLLEELQKQRARVKGARYYAEVDIDAYLIEPERVVVIRDFVDNHARHDLEAFREAVTADPKDAKGGTR